MFLELTMSKLNKLLSIGLLVFTPFLISCQSTQVNLSELKYTTELLYLDQQFDGYQNISIETESDIFALDDEMMSMVEEKLLTERDQRKRTIKLLKQIFDNDNVALSYQNHANVTARQAYHNQAANCMSLTILAYALAKEAELDVTFNQVQVPEYWVRNGDYNMLTGHINLLVKPQKIPGTILLWGDNAMEIDFDPFVLKQSFPKVEIDKKRALAMFYNNKGAQALVALDFITSYAYFKKSTEVDPSFGVTWGNLGILYRQTDNFSFAKKAYHQAIALNESNFTAMTNLAILLDAEGHTEEAKEINDSLHLKRIRNPYYHALLADEAYYDGENELAIKYYKKAIKLNKRIHDFHYGLAKVYYKANKLELAKSSMKKAISLNHTPQIETQYLAKLNFLKHAHATQ